MNIIFHAVFIQEFGSTHIQFTSVAASVSTSMI